MARQFVAVFVAVVVLVGAQPAFADGPGVPGGPGAPGGGSGAGRPACTPVALEEGLASAVIGGPDAHKVAATQNPGATLPQLDVAPIDVDAMLNPTADETFPPVHLVRVRAVPMPKVLRDATIDPGQAVMSWTFTVTQLCQANGQLATCDYHYAEMPDGGLFEVHPLPDGGYEERKYAISCKDGYPAFFAPGAPVDFGVRLLALAKANVAPAVMQDRINEALARPVVAAAGLSIPLPRELSTWANIIAIAISGLAFGLGGCSSNLVGLITSEVAVWGDLILVALGPPQRRLEHAAFAVTAKIRSTVHLVRLGGICTAQIAEATKAGQLFLVPYLMACMVSGTALWFVSALSLAALGVAGATSFWLDGTS